MSTKKDYQKMYRRVSADGRKFVIAQMYRPPDFKEMYYVGWLDSALLAKPIEQKDGESSQEFFSRLERESVVTYPQVTNVTLETSREGGLMARIGRVVSFPARGTTIPPEAIPSQVWEVEVTGGSKNGRVYFFRFIKELDE